MQQNLLKLSMILMIGSLVYAQSTLVDQRKNEQNLSMCDVVAESCLYEINQPDESNQPSPKRFLTTTVVLSSLKDQGHIDQSKLSLTAEEFKKCLKQPDHVAYVAAETLCNVAQHCDVETRETRCVILPEEHASAFFNMLVAEGQADLIKEAASNYPCSKIIPSEVLNSENTTSEILASNDGTAS